MVVNFVSISAMGTATDFLLHLVVVSEESHLECVLKIEEQKPLGAITPTFEKIFPEFPDADTAMDVRPSKIFRELQQGIPAFVAVTGGQRGQAGKDRRLNDERLFHVGCGGLRVTDTQAYRRV